MLNRLQGSTCASSPAMNSALPLTAESAMNSSAATSLSSVRLSMAIGLGPTPLLWQGQEPYYYTNVG